jgi:hypothetical protein
MPETLEKQTEVERLKEAIRQKNGQTERTDNLIYEIMIKLAEDVEELKKRSFQKVYKVKN